MESNGFKAKCPQITCLGVIGVNEFAGSLLTGKMYFPSTIFSGYVFSISTVNENPEVFGM